MLSICINLTLALVCLFVVLARKILSCVGGLRIPKEDLIANAVPVRQSTDAEIQRVVICKVYKTSVFCCFYVLFLQVLVLCFDGVGLIKKPARGNTTNWIILLLPSAHGLAWALLCSLSLCCKFKVSKKYPVLVRIWWVESFVLCLSTIYADGKGFIIEGSEHLNSHVLLNFAMTPALAFLSYAAIRGVTGIQVPRNSDLQDLLEEEAGCIKVTPYSKAGVFSLATLSWLSPLLSLGSKRPLELSDIPLLSPKDRSKPNFKILNLIWEKLKAENPLKQPSLVWAIFKSFWKEALLSAVFAGLNTLALYIGPFLISYFVDYLGGRRRFSHEGYFLTGAFVLSKLVETLTARQWYLQVDILGMNVRSCLTAVLYQKGLRLSSLTKQKHASGDIFNYMAVDVQRVGDYSWFLHDLWMLPLQIILALLILYKNLGTASIATLIATIISILGTVPLARIQKIYQDKLMAAKDDRMRKTSECLRNMRVLKLQAWEEKYRVKLEEMRSVEFKWLRRALYSQAFITFVFWSSPVFVSVVTFGTSILLGGQLRAAGVLSALATLKILQEPLYNFPDLVSDNSDKGIHVKVERGMRVAVCGMVGSGKSSFLSCILGEVPRIYGEVTVCGSVAYVPQSPWIQSGNIEENILFGSPMDRAKYRGVIYSCSLEKDMKLFSHGDQTVIGDRGINLSGGQKQRLQLARALYQDADIQCSLATKTVIFVTHQVDFLPAAEMILVFKEGHITQAGRYEELLAAGTDFSALVSAHHESIEAMDIANHATKYSHENYPIHGSVQLSSYFSYGNKIDNMAEEMKKGVLVSDQQTVEEKKKETCSSNKQLVQDEERERGRVSVDQSVVDLDVPYRLGGFIAVTIQLIGIVGLMTTVTWQLLILFVPTAISCWWMQHNLVREEESESYGRNVMQEYYMASSRELVRLVGIQKSKVIDLFAESIAGASTIRGFRQEKRFMKRNLLLLDSFSRPFFCSIAAIEWLCLRMELLSTFVFGFCMVLLVSLPQGSIDPRMAGLTVTYGLNLNARLSKWILRFCKLENRIISIERIHQYCQISSEAPPVIEHKRPPSSWPERRTIELIDLKVRYKENLPVVLHGITCTFPGGKNIAIVRRTGSGKSTIIHALFRLIELAGGRIVIDNIDISAIGLHDHRSRLSIIPQDPTLFEGTIRENLDPLEEHMDQEIWQALDKSQLGKLLRQKEQNLDTEVLENGDNWSLGQRQLVSLGRALLKQAKILVLDEATASVDSSTDNLIQDIIRTDFKDCTVCTIAHRIPSVIDSDLVLVLNDGRIAEFDTPARLLEDKSSMFLKLVSEYSTRSSGTPKFDLDGIPENLSIRNTE
ncbi:hypothetical protein RJ639_026625 [Escallonia herrerae]|uniref:ABC-type xenobiotic transporter n=1 Tax=Escallonia herrerae TaxID=1293975 RepID=A0AA88SQ44_9ASTE|nr:hypothetical protein RJ639_026625 [Escallonia herrerae]